ncbi:MAG: hypothetical protein MZV63_46005 [Marinilabiliales bacterium]|nr:hypothetical protein [Marinilabiliales bacterium]
MVTRATAARDGTGAAISSSRNWLAFAINFSQNLMEEEQVMNRQILEYITKFLEENKAEYNYQYILGKSFGSVVLYGDLHLWILQNRCLMDLIRNIRLRKNSIEMGFASAYLEKGALIP